MRARRKLNIRTIVYLFSAIATVAFVYVNAPFFYERDVPEPFGFFSDINSAYAGLKYDKCELESIDDSTSGSVDFYFGCTSKQLIREDPQDDDFIYVYYGNCGNVTEFDDSLLDNDLPDYLIEFPFDIKNIGRSYRKRLYIINGTVQKTENVELIEFYASHFNDKNNTLIVEWGDSPSIKEFRFFGINVFKQISYERKSINFYVSDQWMRTPQLVENAPTNFIIELKIPKYYDIKNLENYEISDETHGFEKLKDYITVKADLIEKEVLHLILIDPTKLYIRILISGIWTIFIAKILYDIFKERIIKK